MIGQMLSDQFLDAAEPPAMSHARTSTTRISPSLR